MEESITNSFRINFQCWKILGIWAGKLSSRHYKYYSVFLLFPFLIVYNAILTINLFYIPLEVNLIIEELMYYFYEILIMIKVGTVVFWRKKIVTVCDMLDSDFFKGTDKAGRKIVAKAIRTYKISWNVHAFYCHYGFFLGSILAVLLRLLSITEEINFPVSKYHLLSNETREHYFGYLYTYQVIGIYVHVMFSVTIDSFFAGLLFYAITQIKLLSHELKDLQWKIQSGVDVSKAAQIHELNYCLRHYESILNYCACVQNLYGLTIFAQIGISSLTICSSLCALLLPETKLVFMLAYLSEITLQVFVPALLGSWLASESQKLVFAAYDSDWVPRCESYKSSLKLFLQRANTPVVITGMNFFNLNLETFVAIMKTAYSFITVVRSFQERN